MPNTAKLRPLPFVLAALMLASPARAQDEPPTAADEPAARTGMLDHLSYELSLRGRHDFRTDLEDAGSVAVSRAGLDLAITATLDAQTRLIFGFDYEASNYDFRNATGVIPGTDDPFSDTHEISFRAAVARQIDERWGWIAGGFIRMAAESGADYGDGLVGGGFGGVSQRLNEELRLTLGVAVQSRLEDDTLIIPYITFDWRPSEAIRVWSQGLGVNVGAEIAEDTLLRFFARWEPREYRLADDNTLPDGAIEDDRVVLGMGVTWSANPGLDFDLDLGATVWQEYTAFDSSGTEVGSQDTDPAAFVIARVKFRF